MYTHVTFFSCPCLLWVELGLNRNSVVGSFLSFFPWRELHRHRGMIATWDGTGWLLASSDMYDDALFECRMLVFVYTIRSTFETDWKMCSSLEP